MTRKQKLQEFKKWEKMIQKMVVDEYNKHLKKFKVEDLIKYQESKIRKISLLIHINKEEDDQKMLFYYNEMLKYLKSLKD